MKGTNGQTMLHLIARFFHSEYEHLFDLLAENGTDFNVRDNDENTPLLLLAAANNGMNSFKH